MAYFLHEMSSETCFTEMLSWCERRFPNQPPCWSGLSNQVLRKHPKASGPTMPLWNCTRRVKVVEVHTFFYFSISVFFSEASSTLLIPKTRKLWTNLHRLLQGKQSELIQKSCFQLIIPSFCPISPFPIHGKPTKGKLNNLLAERKEGRTNQQSAGLKQGVSV